MFPAVWFGECEVYFLCTWCDCSYTREVVSRSTRDVHRRSREGRTTRGRDARQRQGTNYLKEPAQTIQIFLIQVNNHIKFITSDHYFHFMNLWKQTTCTLYFKKFGIQTSTYELMFWVVIRKDGTWLTQRCMWYYRRQSSVSKPLVSEATPSNSQDSDKTNIEKKVVLNIWDFSGQSVYYTTHQVSSN